MITATITAKGQITIPAEVRAALGLDVGDRILFDEITPGNFVFKPVQKTSVTVLKGMFGKPKKAVSIAQMNAVIAMRGAQSRITK
jgi:antitoxin PrlF